MGPELGHSPVQVGRDGPGQFRLVAPQVKYCTKIFSMYRIDHILGFYRIYAFPWKPTENDVFLPLTQEQAAERTGGRLPAFKPRGDTRRGSAT